MKKMTNEEFKKDSLDMLIVFSDFCGKNNLKYVLDYGTLLGCIRHKGFIPWDDDIDISMPREDYEKLYNLLKKQEFSFNEKYKLASVRNKYNINKPYFNIIDITTITKSNARKEKYFYPVWIDIFPFDKINHNMNNKNYVKKIIKIGQASLWQSNNIFKTILQFCLIPFRKINFKLADKIYKKDNSKDYNKIYNYYTIYSKKDVYNLSDFNDCILKEFEGKKFRVPKNYDERLRELYGNYMQLPEENKRVAHVNDAYYL